MVETHKLVTCEVRDPETGRTRQMRVRESDVPEGAEILPDPPADEGEGSEDVDRLSDEVARLTAIVAERDQTVATLTEKLTRADSAQEQAQAEIERVTGELAASAQRVAELEAQVAAGDGQSG